MQKIFTTLISLFFLMLAVCNAQEKDKSILETARFRVDQEYKSAYKLYEEAKIDTTIQILKKCVTHSKAFKISSNDTKADVYRLLSMSYLLIDSVNTARSNIKKMLTYRPFYQEENVTADDLDRFIDALDTLIPSPQFYVGFRGGVNYSRIQFINLYSVTEPATELQSTQQMAVNVGFCTGLAITRNFSLAFEPEFFQSKSKLTSHNLLEDIQSSQTINYINLPLTFRANLFFNKRKSMPYLEVGGYYSKLISATQTINNEDIAINSFLNSNNFGYVFGIGYLQFAKKLGFGVNVRYNTSLTLNNNKETRYLGNQLFNNLMYKYYNVFSDFKLSSLSVSVMLVYNLKFKVF